MQFVVKYNTNVVWPILLTRTINLIMELEGKAVIFTGVPLPFIQ